MSIFNKIWISNSCGAIYLFENVPTDKDDDNDISEWFESNQLDDIVGNNFNSCLWGELTQPIQEMKNEWCYDHEQLMWKNGLRCSGCLEDEDESSDEEEEHHRNVKIPCNKCGREVWCEEDCGYGCICFKCQEEEPDDEDDN